jgi:hypothetical protein
MQNIPILELGDWVQVQIKWRREGTRGVSVISGTIVAEDDRVMGHQQYKLDTNMWFSPQADTVLEHRPHGITGSHSHIP